MSEATPNPALSENFQRRAKAKLDEASAGVFFKTNDAKLLPSFDRGTTAAEVSGEDNCDETLLGVKLGEGSFCAVHEISKIVLRRKANSPDNDGKYTFLPQPKQDNSDPTIADTDEADFPVNLFQNKSEIREFMSKNCIREDDTETGHARYALKQLKLTNSPKQLEQGLIDISIEAQFLACINHPNIIKMRGVAGEQLTPNFGLVLDRLYMTLEDRMDVWTEERKGATRGGFCGCLGGSGDSFVIRELVFAAITVAYDLSCALRHLHSCNLVYRDIKPENAGFDVRGDIKLFDFGFCKELRRSLFDKPSGMFKLTKMTGSPPYMAPENFLGKPYGKPVDVFSFGVLVWEMIHCKFAFYKYNRHDYKDVVVERNYRPSIDKSLPMRLNNLISESWDPDPKKRPTFDRISLLLRGEYQEYSQDMNEDDLTRSKKMQHVSMTSFRARNKK